MSNQTGGGIETVTVTARQYSESIQTAPVSVTALNADLLAKLFVHNLADLDHQVPNFTIEGVGAIHRNAAVLYSRGIGYSGVDMGQDPAVGVAVNGVYQPSNVGMLSPIRSMSITSKCFVVRRARCSERTRSAALSTSRPSLPGDQFHLR